MNQLVLGVKRFVDEEQGVTMVEYGLIAALIAIVCIVAITNVGKDLDQVFTLICKKLDGAVTTGGGTASGC